MAIVLGIAGTAGVASETSALLAPGIDLGWLMIMLLGKLVFMGAHHSRQEFV